MLRQSDANFDIGAMPPAAVMRTVNAAGRGDVLSRHVFLQHRNKAGARVGDGRSMSLPAYVGWLIDLRRERIAERIRNTPANQYETHKEKMAERSRLKSFASRDIGEIPEPQHVEDVEACREDLEMFCVTFLPGWFPKVFCEQHRELLGNLQNIIRYGGQQAVALPRGRGKTTITKAACLWATLYGHRKFIVWMAAQDEMAEQAIDGFWMTLRNSQKLIEAFPAACYPLVRGGPDQRSRPLYHGQELNMGRRGLQIILPDIPGSECASAIIAASGLQTAVRGMAYNRPDGTIVRPDAVILDDPQTDESAKSDSQCDSRERLINGAVLGLAGPGVKIAAVMPCTIIRHGDLSSRILNRKINPDWHGIIGKMLETLPLNMPLWERYNAKRIESLNLHNDIRLATQFYHDHRAALDAGAAATWEDEFDHDELSAIQHAMNLYFKDRESFFAERQNCPLQAWDAVEQLTREDLIERITLIPREVVPDNATTVTAFVDVHKDILYYAVVGWRQDFSGQIVSYGTWPDQKSSYFSQRECDYKISDQAGFSQKSLDTQLQMALTDLFGYLDREWQVESGGEFARLRLAMVDANWALSTTAVDRFCATSPWRSRVFPSHGRAISAGQKPIAEWKIDKKDSRGEDWTIPFARNERMHRFVVFDANVWKSRVAEFLLADPGGTAALVLHHPEQQYDHRLLVDHFCAEKRTPKPGLQRMSDAWELPTNRPDNHWWDCVVGCAVAASILGIKIPQMKPAKAEQHKKPPRRARVHYVEG